MATIEIAGPTARDVITLEGDKWSFGKSASSDYALTDGAVSRIHCVFERIGAAWFIRDLSSANGTFVNKERLFGERPLHDGDEILLGRTRLCFRDRTAPPDPTTDVLTPPPALTTRERQVLIELCRPLLNGNAFTQPASVSDIAAAMGVGPPAVKQHLSHLYDKFGITEIGTGRRAALANEALSSGAVTIADIAGAEDS